MIIDFGPNFLQLLVASFHWFSHKFLSDAGFFFSLLYSFLVWVLVAACLGNALFLAFSIAAPFKFDLPQFACCYVLFYWCWFYLALYTWSLDLDVFPIQALMSVLGIFT